MAKTKSKVDFKQLLLTKGEYIALGVAGFFLVILLFSGVSKWLSAQDPDKVANGLKTSAKGVHSKISGTQISPEDEKATVLPPWVTKENKYPPVDVLDFQTTGPQFDPIAKPDTKKRESKRVGSPRRKLSGGSHAMLVPGIRHHTGWRGERKDRGHC